jgi:hypothetical protein
MVALRIDSVRMGKWWMRRLGATSNTSGDSEKLGAILEIAEFESKALKTTGKLLPKESQNFENPSLGVGKWNEVQYLDWEKVLANDDYYANEIRNSFSSESMTPPLLNNPIQTKI